jgi:enamine deaminase RidA (YjgF/YER057c/UK114 family)
MDFVQDASPDAPEDVHMPYAPGIKVGNQSDLLFLSGATAAPLFHDHPHDFDDFDLPDDINEQMRLALDNIQLVLEENDLTFRHVIKVTTFLTDIREIDMRGGVIEEYFGDWKPSSTTIGVNNLSTPGARVELDMIAAFPPE